MPWGPVADFVAVDCETTGLDPNSDEIIQLAAVRIRSGQVQGRFDTLVRSVRPPSLLVQRLTGITPQRLEGAMDAALAVREFRAFCAGAPVVGHNIDFDLGFLRASLVRLGLPDIQGPVFDTLELGRLLCPTLENHRLETLAAHFGITLDNAHDAGADALASAWLFLELQAALRCLTPELRATLGDLLAGAPSTIGPLIPPPDLPVLPRSAAAVSVEPAGGPVARVAVTDPEALEDLLTPGSAIAAALEPFEPRPGQRQLLRAVWKAFATERHLIAEAGTGTGKSLGYLLPAVAWAQAADERVVVATHTLNLQEQLIGKDLPVVSRALPTGGVALLKGRGQYLCRKLWSERRGSAIAAEDRPFAARIAVWDAATATGDRGELMLYGQDEERFGSLSCEAVACTGRHCPFYEGCYLFEARRRAEQAHVVVVNHALLLSDLARGGGVLPEHAVVVCDEAHHLESEAAAHLGHILGERALDQYFRRLVRGPEEVERARGVLPTVRGQLEAHRLLDPAQGGQGPIREAESYALQCEQSATLCFGQLRSWAASRRPAAVAGRWTVRFAGPGTDDARFRGFVEEGAALADTLRGLARSLGAAADAIEETAWGGEPAAELRALGDRAGEVAGGLEQCIGTDPEWVTWCEVRLGRDGSPGVVTLHAAPIDPGRLLERLLFGAHRSVVLTSATLTVGGSFDFVRGRLGIQRGPEAERTDTLMVDSPFTYRDQALLCLPTDLRMSSGSPAAMASAAAPFLVRLFAQTGGGALVLCTSHAMLRTLHQHLRGPLERQGIVCLAQGLDGSRSALTAALRRDESTVVLGSASFWEGVDVAGPALRCLVIAQLPFWPPDMPLLQAHLERIAASGGNGFGELQLPQAVLRFKQGFGRLIRRADDRGVVVVLDPRIGTRSYGGVFVRSLPGPAVLRGGTDEVLGGVGEWLGHRA